MTLSEIQKINPQPGWLFKTKDGKHRELTKLYIDKEGDSVIIFGWFHTASIYDIEEFIPPHPKELNPT